MTVRPATSEDTGAVTGLEHECFGPDAWSRAQVHEELTGPHRRAWIAERDGDVVGYAIIRTVADTTDLQRIAVRPDQRRHGLASRLLDTASPQNRMLLEVAEDNVGAIAFYARHGFAEIHRRPGYYRSGASAIVMARDEGGVRRGRRQRDNGPHE